VSATSRSFQLVIVCDLAYPQIIEETRHAMLVASARTHVCWFFSNLSPDIRALFCATCDRLGLRWTQSNHRNLSISHRASVARIDEAIGAKA
jgi:hypothetical protein